MSSDTQVRISGVILAAGRARRFGCTKQLLAFRETTLLGQVVENARRSRLAEVIVVLGHDAAAIRDRVDLAGLQVVLNQDFDRGQGSSVRAGLARVSPHSDAVMFLLGDQPLVESAVIDTLIAAAGRSPYPLIVPRCQGRRGNPVIVGRELMDELAGSLTGDAGARVLFARHPDRIDFVELDHGCIHVDVDTLEDYHRLLRRVAGDKRRSTHGESMSEA